MQTAESDPAGSGAGKLPPRAGTLISLVAAGVLMAWAASQFTHERFNAVALLVAALSFYYLGARFYSAFVADRVLRLDDSRITPAHRRRDNRDHMPFRRWTLFGMHFAWIAGPGPLIGPTLAAQFGFLPGFLWIVLGAVFIGCVQDFVILVFSTRRDGMSLARMIRREVNPLGGFFAALCVLFILEVLLGVLALVVVKALNNSPWGTFTIAASIPIAFFVGYYMTRLRPGHEGQATAIGVFLLIVATALGAYVADNPALSRIFTLSEGQLGIAIVIYGFCAAALPAWLLLAPRDNISTYLKIGTVVLLAAGIFIAQPAVHMPAVTRFVNGGGPIAGLSGGVFPFCFIIIACGAISGFHALISSGVTPRFVDKESDMRVVGYGAMLTESFVGVMALIAAVTLAPGVYLAMNHAPLSGAPPKPDAAYAARVTAKISGYGEVFRVTPGDMDQLQAEMKEPSLYHRTGGAPSLAVGMAQVLGRIVGGAFLPFWYHFALMFEAVFILTVLDSGTRVIRFIVQEVLADLAALKRGPPPDATVSASEAPHAPLQTVPVWLTSGLAVTGWGLILWWGVWDKQGGTQALLRMFGTANQLLACIALTLATVIMLKTHRAYTWVTAAPAAIVGAITLTAAGMTLFSPDPKIGQIAAAQAAKTAAAVQNAWLTAFLTGLLLLLVGAVLVISIREIAALLRSPRPDMQPTEV